MTDSAAQEPTMEEILASIRRIISEDDAPAESAEAAPAPAAAEAAPEPQPEPQPESPAMMDETPSVQEPAAEDDVLELTEPYVEPAAAESIGDLDVAPFPSEPEPAPAPTSFTPEPEPAPAPAPAATPAFSSDGSLTIEALVRQILEPQIKAWADDNLDRIMQDVVRAKLANVFK